MKRFFLACILALSLSGSIGLALPAAAQVDTGLDAVGQTVKLSSTDPRIIVARIINISLGLIGIILVVLMIYAGFLYMTSGGETEKVTKAKKIIQNAIIGLIIILSAWAITKYVIEKLLSATQDGGGGQQGGGQDFGQGFGQGKGADSFHVKSITPAGDVKIKNVQVKIVFSKAVDEKTATAILITKVGGTTVGGSITVDGSVVTFTPADACPNPNQDKKCFAGDSDFLVKVGGSVKSKQGQSVTCNAFGFKCEGKFHTGNLIDTQPPSVSISYPTPGMKVQEKFIQEVIADASDDSGVATVGFFDGFSVFDVDSPVQIPTPQQFTAKGMWDTAGIPLGAHTLYAGASDIDTNSTKSFGVTVMVKPEHCFNEKQDADKGETGIDCGGDPNSPNYCGACAGQSCVKNEECANGFCIGGKCVEKPVIQTVAPLNGKPGTFVTIKGANFGFLPGKVVFLGGAGDKDDKVALPPAACIDGGFTTWSNTQVIVAVPDAASSGPLMVQNVASGLSDTTDQDPGPKIPNFLVDNTDHPGLCAMKPSSGTVGSQADLLGQGFGGTPKTVIFGKNELSPSKGAWSETKITITVPVVNSAPYAVSVKTDGGESNPVNYTVIDKNLGAAPELQLIDPPKGAQQTYLTLQGKNFGYDIGTVIFTGVDGEALGDVSFPPQCSDGFWTDDHIVVKAPSKYKNNQSTQDGKFQVKVKRPDAKESNALEFTLDSKLPVGPGICSMQPSIGPVGTFVTLVGEAFGVTKPVVTFHISQPANVDNDYTNQIVHATVPSKAQTGPLQMTANGKLSNKILFQVKNCNEAADICGPKMQCCPSGQCLDKKQTCGEKPKSAEFAWQTSTGLIPMAPHVVEECLPKLPKPPTPSPSPWINRPGGNQAPIDSQVTMRFSKVLKPATVTPNQFHLFKCTGNGNDPCLTAEDVPFSLKTGLEDNKTQQVVTLQVNTPSKKFSTSTTYLVTVSTGIQADGPGGALMDEMKSCGLGPKKEKLGYCFRFRTRESSESSKVGSIQVIPDPYYAHGNDESIGYSAQPIYSDDACIVLDCRQFDWKWSTGDARASITMDKELDGNGKCDQIGSPISETGDVPVDIIAALPPVKMSGKADLYINFLPPIVESYGPNCSQACTNALIWAQFTAKLNKQSVVTPGNVELRKCKNENCVESDLIKLNADDISLMEPFGSQGDVARMIAIKPIKVIDGKSALLLEPGAFYQVLLKGGPKVPNGIKGENGVPMAGLNHPLGFQWKFRVKLGNEGAFCKAEKVIVTPAEKYESIVGGKQVFTATPFGKTDECNASGQALIQTTTSAWLSSKITIAQLFKLGQGKELVDTGGKPFLGCSGKCLATGATGEYGKVAICGNDKIETTDSSFCNPQTKKTPKGSPCEILPSGAAAGEECEVKFDSDTCDPTTCLLMGIKNVAAGGSCGNGTFEPQFGEACDFGPTCVGGSQSTSTPPVPEFTPCGNPVVKSACEKAKGECSMHDYRGCSMSCRHLGSIVGKSTCGNNDIKGDGKDCDDGNLTDGDGCSSLCLHESSEAQNQATAVCGNGVMEPGEVCEAKLDPNGKPIFSNGCNTKTCLHAGANAVCGPQGTLCCGNAKIEDGEDCDDGNYQKSDGCSSTCLFEGSSAEYVPNALTPSFCPNGILELGEQCEAGKSSSLVAEKIGYKAQQAIPGTSVNAAYAGLNPTSQKGDGLADQSQLGYIVGQDILDESGKMVSEVTATLEGQTGKALYGLQCGFTSEDACEKQKPGYGLDKSSCCSARPVMVNRYPKQGASKVCRNVQIQVQFKESMDAQSVVNNIELAQSTSSQTCALGTQEVLADATPVSSGVWGVMKTWWHHVLAWFGGGPALAEKWCTGGVSGQLLPIGNTTSSKQFAFVLDHALQGSTKYRVRFLGDHSTKDGNGLADNSDPAKRQGIKTANGVVHPFVSPEVNGDVLSWNFTTGDQVCGVNIITVYDTTPEPALPDEPHPFLFVNTDGTAETRNFTAQAQTVENGIAVPLSPVAEYQWSWNPWTSSDLTVVPQIVSNQSQEMNKNTANATAAQKNGSSILTATLEVTTDTVSIPSTKGSIVQGNALVTVSLCENPWPSLKTAPFQDKEGSTSTNDIVPNSKLPLGNPFGSSYFNFSTMYCRDSGEPHVVPDDFPSLKINLVPKSDLDEAKLILRQYLFTYPPEDNSTPEVYKGLQKDGIGIRIVSNPQHYSPEEWYKSQGFTGNPKSVTVDGYPALQDGGTVYVAAANRSQAEGGKIYSNIYLISHNPDAKQTTLLIYDQLVKNLAFNINLLGQSNVCVADSKKPFTDPNVNDEEPIHCVADWECFTFGKSDLHCDSLKLKLTRDTQRMADFQLISRAMENAKSPLGVYPQALSGTYLKNFSTSLWNSWGKEVGSAVGGKAFPVDPINRFLTCGLCELTNTPCQSNADCPNVNNAAQACKGGYYTVKNTVLKWNPNSETQTIDPLSCWDQKKFIYYCPSLTPGAGSYGVSRLYQYQALAGGTQYKLGSEYEVLPKDPNGGDWWSPPLPDAAYRCAATSTLGVFCNGANGKPDDSLCRACMYADSKCQTCQTGAKKGQACANAEVDCGDKKIVCKDDGTNKAPAGSCRQMGGSYTYSGVCQNVPFGANGTCGDGVLNQGEICDVGMMKQLACTAEVDKKPTPGLKQQVCNLATCKDYIDDVQHPQCVTNVICGNGRIDKTCGGAKNDPGCLGDAECSNNKKCIAVEKCDDGALNGTYGYCAAGNNGCQGYSGFCGDAQLSPGEFCDQGADKNGSWSDTYNPNTCSLDCKAVGPYCGNQEIDGAEACDGASLYTTSAVCSSGNVGTQCTKQTEKQDCGANGVCGGGVKDKNGHPVFDSCVGWQVDVQGVKRETQHIRTCNKPGAPKSCQLADGWSECQPIGLCGDGVKDVNEECDDGKDENGDTKACLNSCKKNTCGDGFPLVGVEDCDKGPQNGSITCNADYDSMCLSCTKSCKFQATAGGYCGDKFKNGPEQCDGSVPGNLTCKALGFDYGVTMVQKKVKPSCVDSFEIGVPPCAYVSVEEETQIPICAPSCSFGGCYHCQDVPGKGVMEGRIFDAVFQQVVPGARVSVLYKGNKVDEIFTDENGYFKISTLNTNASCSAYRIVVDMYQDNVCTGPDHPGTNCAFGDVPPWTYPQTIDEGALGGYFPYTSELFSHGDASPISYKKVFDLSEQGLVNVYLFPRPEFGKAYASILWKGTPSNPFRHLHTVVPLSSGKNGFVAGKDDNDIPISATCEYGKPAVVKVNGKNVTYPCARDITWKSPGDWDIDMKLPNARLICLHKAGETSKGSNIEKNNGCPVEGTDACLLKKGMQIGSCKSYNILSQASKLVCDACGAGPTKECATAPNWESCFQVERGPMTTWLQYKVHELAGQPIQFYFSGDFEDPVSFKTSIVTTFAIYKYTAYVAVGDTLHSFSQPSGSGFVWHLGELNPVTGAFTQSNELIGKQADQGLPGIQGKGLPPNDAPAPGMACFAYNYQCSSSKYCVNSNKLTEIKGMCFYEDEQKVCTNPYSCNQNWDFQTYLNYNW